MASDQETRVGQPAIRTLTKQEIDRRIEGLIREIALLRDEHGDGPIPDGGDLSPRWLPASELVRRLRRFIVYN
jgi:hypothetical protein